jgi:hypothetical protein
LAKITKNTKDAIKAIRFIMIKIKSKLKKNLKRTFCNLKGYITHFTKKKEKINNNKKNT